MIDFDDVRLKANGRWLDILANLGISIREDGKHSECPMCKGGKDRFRFDDKDGRGTWFCSQCEPSAGDGFVLIQKVLGIEIKEAMEAVSNIVGSCKKGKIPKESKGDRDMLRSMFINSEPAIKDNLVGKYLASRGLTVVPETLKFCKKCYEAETRKNQLAMLAVFSLPDGEAVTMHRTYLNEHGGKLDIDKPKKILPSLKKMTGGAVRLFEVDGILGVAEGIETALAVHESMHIPVWACLSATLLEAFIPPPTAKSIMIFADNDKNFTGQKSAYILANRLTVQNKIPCAVYVPGQVGEDWLDDLNRKRNF